MIDIINWDVVPDSMNELSKFIFTSKYARHVEHEGRREDWKEAVDRVEGMHLKKFRGKLTPAQRKEIKNAFSMVRDNKAVLPSMRSMQFGGPAVEAHQARIFNCSVRHVDSLRSLSEIFYLLLCGCGVGIGLSKHFLNRMPDLVSKNDRTGTVVTYVIEDSIEGWADSLEALLMCYTRGNAWSGRKIVFDYSKIRPRGARLKTGGGKAPGHEPLKEAHNKIKALLGDIVEKRNQERLLSIDVYDILMYASDAVLAGGSRRSAASVVFDKDDEDMLNAKTGNWSETNPQRARSNNSVLLIRDKVSKEEFKNIVERTREWGEPGFVFAEHDYALYNPCFTVDQRILTDKGWQTFQELLDTTPLIHQDPRIRGSLVDGKEQWSLTGEAAGKTLLTQAFNVRKTGEQQDIFKLTMSCGRTVRATGNHHFATPDGMVELSDLSPGDKVLVGTPEPASVNKYSYDYKLGMLMGLCAGDGNLSDRNVNLDIWETAREDRHLFETLAKEVISSAPIEIGKKGGRNINLSPTFGFVEETDGYTKYRLGSAALYQIFSNEGFVTKNDSWDWIHDKSKDMKAGFVSGLFYADGHFEGNAKSKTVAARVTQSNYEALQTVMLVMQELGVMARIYKLLEGGLTSLPNGKGGMSEYETRPSFRLSWSGKESLVRFNKWAYLLPADEDIQESFVTEVYGDWTIRSRNKTQYESRVLSVDPDGIEDVYCLQEDVNRTLIAQGLTARRCFEVAFLPVTEDGVCGVQMCNLTSINGAKVDTAEDFYQAAEAAALIGTLQATYSEFPYLSSAAEELTKEEALLGVSITAMMENPDVILDPIIQQNASKIVVETNKKWAEILGINPAARCTVIKPEGTGSLAAGTMANGIHAAHARWMIRRVQMNKNDNVFKHFAMYNPHMVEDYIYNSTDAVVSFPIRVSDETMIKSDLDALTHLDIIKSTQANWVIPGTTDANKKPIHHNVSCTVQVQEHEWEGVIDYLHFNRYFFSAVSLFPSDGDKKYPQAPYEKLEENDPVFAALINDMKPVDYATMQEWTDETEHMQESSCAGGACEI